MNKAVFLDRDGTINVEKGYLHRLEDFVYLPGAVEGLRLLQEMGFLLIVITNQSGIARGYYTEDDYLKLDRWMKADLESKGVHITASYYCPHHPKASIPDYRKVCECRKPGTGLFRQAIREWNIELSGSYAIGDRERDLAICVGTGCKGYLVGNAETSTKYCRTGSVLECAKLIKAKTQFII